METTNDETLASKRQESSENSSTQFRHISSSKSYQLRALARKTISYQKRQMFVNICCVSLCPLMMVALSAIMGIVARNLLESSFPPEEFLACSNLTAVNEFNLPITNEENLPTTPAEEIPNTTLEGIIKHTNYYMLQFQGDPNRYQSCSFWFEKPYPFSSPYEIDPEVTDDNLRRDSTFKPDPLGGWFGPAQSNAPLTLITLQTKPWAIVRDSSNVDSGNLPQLDPVESTEDFVAQNATFGDGFLGSSRTNYFYNITLSDPSTFQFQDNGYQAVPYYQKSDGSVEEVDDIIAQQITQTLKQVASVNKASLLRDNATTIERLQYFSDISSIIGNLPWGAILIDLIDPQSKLVQYTIQMGRDRRVSSAASFPSASLRQLVTMNNLNNAFIKTLTDGAARIIHGLRVMPEVKLIKVDIPVATVVGRILFPFGVSFLIPIFVVILVKEKEDRILIMMKMNGLKEKAYYITHYAHFYSLHILSSLIFIAAGLIFQLEFFTLTNPGVYLLLFFVWGHAQIALAFFFSCFFGTNRNALVIVFLIILCGIIIQLATQFIFQGDYPIPLFIWPPFAFYSALSVISTASIDEQSLPYRMQDLTGTDYVSLAMIFLTVETIIFFLLSSYLTAILPSQYGVRKPWYFIFSRFLKKDDNQEKDLISRLIDQDEVQFEDDDVKEERQRVLENRYPGDSPLVVKRMRKIYPSNNKLAVKDVSLAVESNRIFGLLGPNGAGKTSLISILTGLYPPTDGSATLNGFSITTEMEQVYMNMGLCPQHDILWDDLSIEEHILFYCRLKGIPPNQEKEATQKALEQVSLADMKHKLSKSLSGGQKRRLSIAIALVGNPAVVFLDEPTTGLDPEVKRVIWNIVNDAKQGRTIVLTTHSMEEAEVLCNRIGIMAKGTLRCVGSLLRLKQLYGSGFKLAFSCNRDYIDQASLFVENLLPPNWKKIDNFATNVSYEFHAEKGTISNLFRTIESNKREYGINDWGLSQTTLEEVFLKIISEADAEAD